MNRWAPVHGLLLALTILAVVAGAALAAPGTAPPLGEPVAPPEHRRGEDQTYLTYPEWFLVHSPAEYARFIADQPPSEFPYFGHIAQFWGAYAGMNAAMGEGDYAFNLPYHIMVFVIGTSTTVEYALKAGYERLFGQFFEGAMTAEDDFGAFVAQDYVDFIMSRPWYEYDFGTRLAQLWTEVPLLGARPHRKWERRYALTTEYAVKAIYAKLIGFGTAAGYDAPIPVTVVLTAGMPAVLEAGPEIEVLQRFEDGRVLLTLPRYAAFSAAAQSLAARGVEFIEIAGNRGVIVLSVLIDESWQAPDVAADVLLEQDILTEPGRRRQVLRVAVADLGPMLRALRGRAEIEHVYDY